MRLTYDPATDLLSMRLRSGKIARSEDIDDGVVFLYDDAGRVIGVTFADARQTHDRRRTDHRHLRERRLEAARLPSSAVGYATR